jgi:hypothetical protein
MRPNEFGIQGLAAEDRDYRGSRYADVRDAMFANPYQPVWRGPGELPSYSVTLSKMLFGLIPAVRKSMFAQASARIIDSNADLRWGPDGRGYRRLVHPNGICLFGRWEITEPTPYSGYFQQGSQALAVARYSTCCTETRRGHGRSLSMVVKLFPTTNPEHATPLPTANLMTQQDLGGGYETYINDVELLNAPSTHSWRRGSGLAIFVATGIIFNLADREPTIRQLYEIAELGKPAHEPTRAPQFLRLLVAADQPRIQGFGLDFRDEIMHQIFDPGDPVPKRSLGFTVDVTDDGDTRGPAAYHVRTFRGWRRIGTLTFDGAVASYNADFVLHFHHPTFRSDRNDPSTATRVAGRKVH